MICNKIKLYPDREDVTLTTYVLDDSPEMKGEKNRGAVIICPGGAFVYCSDREGEPIAMEFAAMGYHAFVLRYSVYNENKEGEFLPDFSGPLEQKLQCAFPNFLYDLGTAMLFIREHAEEWHVDTDKIAICGFSAGGQVCSLYAAYHDRPLLTEYFHVDAKMLRPATAIIAYGVSDNTLPAEKIEDPVLAALMKLAEDTVVGDHERSDEFAREISSAKCVNEHTPPMFLWATAQDGNGKQTLALANALADAKVPYEVHVFEEGQHGLSTATQASAGCPEQINARVAQWVPLAESWLEKRMALEFPETKIGF